MSGTENKVVAGKLDIDVKPLKQSLGQAKEEVGKFNNYMQDSSKKLSQFGIDTTNFDNSLKKSVEDLKQQTGTINESFSKMEESAKKVSSNMARYISDSWKANQTTTEKALENTKSAIKKYEQEVAELERKNNTRRENYLNKNGNLDGFSEKGMTRKIQQLAKLQTLKQQLEKTLNKDALGDLKYTFKIEFKGDKEAYLKYLNELKQSADITKNDLIKIAKEEAQITEQIRKQSVGGRNKEQNEEREREKQFAEQSKKLWESVLLAKETQYNNDKVAYKHHLDWIINSEKLAETELKKAIMERVRTVNKANDDIMKKAKQISQVTGESVKSIYDRLSKFSTDAQHKVVAEIEKMKTESEKLVKQTDLKMKIELKGDLGQAKTYLEEVKNMENISVQAREKLEEKYVQVVKKLDNERLAHHKKIQEEMVRYNEKVQAQMIEKQNTGSNIGATMIQGAVIYKAGQQVKSMISNLSSLEYEVADLSRVMSDATSKDIENLKNCAFENAKNTNQTVQDVLKVENAWSRVSDKIANNKDLMMDLTKVTSVAMNVGGFNNAEQAVAKLNGALLQMKMDYKDASKLLDSWIKTADVTSAGTAEDMANVFTKVGKQAQMLGLDYRQLNAITGLLANTTAKSGDEIGTALKTVFSYFQDPATIKTLYKHGVYVMKNKEEYNNLIDVMNQLIKKEKEYQATGNQAGMRDVSNSLGKIRRIDIVNSLITNWGQYQEILDSTSQSEGYAQEQNAKMVDNLSSMYNKLKVDVLQLSDSFGKAGLTDALKGLMKIASDGLQWINGFDQGTKKMIVKFAELGMAMYALNKAKSILMRSSFGTAIKNDMAKMAIMTGNQKKLNRAIESGASVIHKDTQAIKENTQTKQSNLMASNKSTTGKTKENIAQNSNTRAEKQNTQATRENTRAKNENGNVIGKMGSYLGSFSSNIRQSTKALGQQKNAQVSVNNASVLGRGILGSLGATGVSAFKSIISPLNLATMAVGYIINKVVEYNAKVKEMQQRTEDFTKAQRRMNDELKKSSVGKDEVDGLKNKIQDLKEAKQQIDGLRERAGVLQNQIQKFYDDSGGGFNFTRDMMDCRSELSEVNDKIDEHRQKLEEQGIAMGDIDSVIDRYNEQLANSGDENNRVACEIDDKLSKMMNENDQLIDLIAQYQDLHSEIEKGEGDKKKYDEICQTLTAHFGDCRQGIDSETGAVYFNIDAINKAIGAKNTINEVKVTEMEASYNLSDAERQCAINHAQQEQEKTNITIENARKRIEACKAEMEANQASVNAIKSGWKEKIFEFFGLKTEDMVQAEHALEQSTAHYNQALQALSNAESSKGATIAHWKGVENVLRNHKFQGRKTGASQFDHGNKPAWSPPEKKTRERKPRSGSGRKKKSDAEREAEKAKREADKAKRLHERQEREQERHNKEMIRQQEEAYKEYCKAMDEHESKVLSLQSKLVNALKAKYKEERDARVKYLQDQEKAEIKVKEGKIKELQDKIKALQNTDNEEKSNLESLKRALSAWKKDDSDYGRQKAKEIEKQIKEREKELTIKEYEKKVDDLQKEEDAIKDSYANRLDSQSQAYDKQLAMYDKALQDRSLYEEANKMIIQNKQSEILDLLEKYAPEYGRIGLLLGQSMREALSGEVNKALESMKIVEANVKYYFEKYDRVSSNIQQQQAKQQAQSQQRRQPAPSPQPKNKPTHIGGMAKVKNQNANAYLDSEGKRVLPWQKQARAVGVGYDSAMHVVNKRNGMYALGTSGSINSAIAWVKEADLVGLRTGGYTGDWGDGDGKLALLHQKERVLSANQTRAFEHLVYDILPDLKVNVPNFKGASNKSVNNYNAPLVKNEINVVNNTPFETRNSMNNLEKTIKTELRNIGYNTGIR